MSKILYTTAAIVVIGVAAMGSASARHARPASARGYYGAHATPTPTYGEMERPVTPQFNEPGPQISVPQPGNAVEQLSPLMGAGQPDALGIK